MYLFITLFQITMSPTLPPLSPYTAPYAWQIIIFTYGEQDRLRTYLQNTERVQITGKATCIRHLSSVSFSLPICETAALRS